MTKPVPSAPPPRRVALYLRVSTDLQAGRDEGSLDTQEARLRAAVKSRAEDCEIRHVFREEGESGKSLDRPEVQKLLAAIRAGEIDLLIVTRLDRLSRSLLDFFEVNRLLEKHHVQFQSLNETFDTTTAMGMAMLKIVLVFAELERAQTAERTKVAMKARAERGLWNGGSPPLGYTSLENGHLEVHATEAEIVRLIFDRYTELRSTMKLARWLNDRGHRQKAFTSRRKGSTGGKPFSISVLQGMLANRLYLGEIKHKGELFAGQHEALVTPELFERVRQILADNDRNLRVAPARAKYDYLLTGTLRCACGYALTTSAGRAKGRSYHYYRCVGIQKVDRHACPVKNVRADLADATVMEIIREAARDPKMLSAAVEEANRIAQQTVAPLRERVASMKRDIAAAERTAESTLDTLLMVGLSDSPTAKRRLAEAEEKVRQVRLALAEAEGELAVREGEQLDAEVMAQALGSFDEAFDHLTSDERREFLRLMIKQVTVYKDRIVVDLYEGRQATGYLVAVTTGAQSDAEAAKTGNPGRVDQGFVAESKWLPVLEQARTFVNAPDPDERWQLGLYREFFPDGPRAAIQP